MTPRKRVRLTALVVQFGAVIDDGEHLTPLTLDQVTVLPADWEAWAGEGLAAELRRLEDQLNAAEP